MTDMQLLVPPLDDDSSSSSSSSSNSNHLDGDAPVGLEEEEDGGTSHHDHANKSSRNKDSNILSDELKENFEAMKSLWRQSRRATASSDDEEELRHRAREKAVETAVAVDSEILRWQNSISELESLLAEQEDRNEDEGVEADDVLGDEMGGQPWQARRQNMVAFPSLPPVIPPEDEDEPKEGSKSLENRAETTNDVSSSS